MPEGKKPSYRNSWLWGIQCPEPGEVYEKPCSWNSNLFPCPKTAVKDLDNHLMEVHDHTPDRVYATIEYGILRIKRDFKKHPLGALKKGSESRGIEWNGKV